MAGMYANLNPLLEDLAIKTFKNTLSNLFEIEAKIYSDTQEDLVIYPRMFNGWTIVHDFTNEYHEKMSAVITISMEEAMLLLGNTSDLRISVILRHVTQHYYELIRDIPDEVHQFRVLISNPSREDMASKVTQFMRDIDNPEDAKDRDELIRVATYELNIELVTEEVYNISKFPFNSITKQSKLEDVVHYVANVLGIKKVHMVPADNTAEHKHIFIPPFSTIEILDKLQQTKGVYTKGIGYFIYKEELYVYPEFDTDPKQFAGKPTGEVRLYRLPQGCYPGCPCYCKVGYPDEEDNLQEGGEYTSEQDGQVLSIVLVGNGQIVNAGPALGEAAGNYVATQRTDTLLDIDTKQKGKEAEVNKNNGFSVTPAQDAPASSNVTGKVSLRYEPTNNNPLAMSSTIASYQSALLACQWDAAWPWFIHPGRKVVYYYEEKKALKTANGVIAGVTYKLEPMRAGFSTDYKGRLMVYGWSASIAARLAIEIEPEQYTAADLTENGRQVIKNNQQG